MVGVLAAVAILIIALAAGAYFRAHRKTASVPPTATSTDNTYTLPDGSTLTLPPGAVVKEEDVPVPGTPAPNYKKPLIISASVSAEVKAAMQSQFLKLTAAIQKNPTDFASWMKLGSLRKIGGDYKGAEEDWVYMSKLYPKNYVSYNNLGDLYMNFTKEYPKAETNFRVVIALKPDDIDTYKNLFLLYRDLYKTQTTLAGDILKEGLKNNPGNAELTQLLSEYQGAKTN